jgi:phosphatidate phosphatase APP1
MRPHRWVVDLERVWDTARGRRPASRVPAHFRIEPYIAYAGVAGVVVRGRVLDDPPPSAAVEGEGAGAALRRTLRSFVTDDLPGVPLRVTVAGTSTTARTDDDGYFVARLEPDVDRLVAPWTTGVVELDGSYRGIETAHATPFEVRVVSRAARFGIISDIDDTILESGVQRVGRMIHRTMTGSALTRTPFVGAAELYRDLAGEVNPVFYVSSSPWNLHAFLIAFLRHRSFPLGPVLLRDLLGSAAGREQKDARVREVLEANPHLPFVLVGDSGERDPQIYADAVQAWPGRILAVYIREVRLDPGDGRVEQVSDAWAHEVPFVLVPDSEGVRRHATGIGLLSD